MQSIQNHQQQQQQMTTQNNDNNLSKELKHLNHRIRKLQEIIQLSSSTTALANPSTWQTNCLLAVRNCVNEWKHIVLFYHLYENLHHDVNESNHDQSQLNNDNNHNNHNNIDFFDIEFDIDLIKKSALNIFNLIQMSIQVGPLKGSNPGYFKRCGVHVAMMALQFLKDCVCDVDDNNTNNDINNDINNDVNNDINYDINNHHGISRNVVVENIEEDEQVQPIITVNDDTTNEDENRSNDSDSDSHNIDTIDDDDDHHYDDDHDDENNNESIETNHNHDNHDHNLLIVIKTDKLLLFTQRQHDIICKWMINAEKAIKANKPPSKAALKLQQSSRSKKSQKKLKYQQKQLQQSKKHKNKKKK